MPQAVDPAIETFARIKAYRSGVLGGAAAVNRMVDAGIEGGIYKDNTDACRS